MELIPKRKLQLRWLWAFFIVHSSKDIEFQKKNWFFSPHRNTKMLVLECELFLKCKWHDFTAAFIKTAKSSHQLVWCDFFDAISTIVAHFNQRPYVCYEYDTIKKIYRIFSSFSKFLFHIIIFVRTRFQFHQEPTKVYRFSVIFCSVWTNIRTYV